MPKLCRPKLGRGGNENPGMKWQSKARKTQNTQSIAHKDGGGEAK